MSPTQPNTSPALIGHSVPVCASKERATAEAWGKKRHSYKPLRKQFRHQGFDYQQIWRQGDWAVYEQTSSGCGNSSIAFEIIRVRRREGFEIHGRFVEAAEVYPASEAWGTDAFTVADKDSAFAKLSALV